MGERLVLENFTVPAVYQQTQFQKFSFFFSVMKDLFTGKYENKNFFIYSTVQEIAFLVWYHRVKVQ